jgi:Protein of unknown function (DUF3144)
MKNTDEEQYWTLVEQFIEQANIACENVDIGIVSAALSDASARFNAFCAAQASLDKKEFAEDLEGSINFYTGRYRELLREHMNDYQDHFADLIGSKE